MMITLDAIEIQKIIPHRYPMLLVDRILELEPMEKGCRCQKYYHERIAVLRSFPW